VAGYMMRSTIDVRLNWETFNEPCFTICMAFCDGKIPGVCGYINRRRFHRSVFLFCVFFHDCTLSRVCFVSLWTMYDDGYMGMWNK
jgi:hypothetical protein